MKEKLIFVFPGQGAQHVGMCKDIYDNFQPVRETFQNISDIANKDIANLCFNGTTDDLKKPVNSSLCIFTHSVAVGHLIEQEFKKPLYEIAYALSGYSLGQYPALYFADSIPLEETVRGLASNAFYVSNTDKSGGMACVMGLFKNQLDDILEKAKPFGFVAVSNYNLKNQFVVSGETDALLKVIEISKQYGAKIAKMLDAAIPVHCELMRNSENKLIEKLKKVNIKPPKTNWFSSTTGNVMGSVDDVKATLAHQMTKGVRWLDVMEKFPAYNIKYAYELGPGTSLTGLIKRADVGCTVSHTDNMKFVQKMLTELENIIVKTR